MPKTKVEVYDKDQLIYPFIESDHVTFSNGMKVSEMLDQSISMPTVTHEDLSFKVGVGDQDVSSAIVDSSVSKMTIKGKTYQNILPEPSTHILTNNKEMFKVNEGLDPNVEIVDGVSRSAILSGSTKYRDISSNKIYDSYESATNVWSENKYKLWSAQDGGATSELNGTITSGTDIVTLDFHAINHSTYKLTGNCTYKKVVFYDSNQTFISSTRTAATTNDLVVNNIPSNARYVRFAFFPHADNTGSCSIVDENNNPINLRQIQLISCKMPVLSTTGKNLIPLKEDWVQGQIMNGGGISVNSYALRTKSKIKVKPNTKYTFSTKSSDCKIAYHEWEANGKYVKDSGWITAFPYTFTTNNKTEYINLTTRRVSNVNSTVDNLDDTLIWQLEESSTATSYEPYKTNILSTPEEVVLRSLPNGVKDTLNLNTGEYVQRIGEVIYTGKDTEGWRESVANYESDDIDSFYTYIHNPQSSVVSKHCHCNLFPVYYNLPSNPTFEYFHILNAGSSQIVIGIKRSKLSSQDSTGIKAWLQANPLTIQYELATPIVKTVDLLSSGNWEKVVLDGSENWRWDFNDNQYFQTYIPRGEGNKFNNSVPDRDGGSSFHDANPNHYISFAVGNNYGFTVKIVKSEFPHDLSSSSGDVNLNVWKQYLSQNPITVWYQTTTYQDSTQVKQPIFFKDGHIVQSSGAGNSLIPTLDYQAKTSNSYVMDLMKASTKYTMKAKSASGTFTIDGTSYGAGTNGTFTTPSSMTNKLLVMSNKTNKEVMIIEGDVVSKTIPYFKGIKSAFEDESKIEVLSTGKNLFDGAFEKGMIDVNGNLGYTPTAIRTVNYISVKPNASYHINLLNLEPFESARVVYVHEYDENFKVLGETQVDNRNIYTSKSATKFIKINTHNAHDLPVDSKMIVCENSTLDKQYEPYKSNNTKIPLLSPLRSLPNGVCDELIVDRESNKATLIQRVREVVLNGNENWVQSQVRDNHYVAMLGHCSEVGIPEKYPSTLLCSHFINQQPYAYDREGINVHVNYNLHIGFLKNRLSDASVNSCKKWLSQNPVIVHHELTTPVVTEIDLEGFPYIYKDGHIFLNGEIAPTTEIIYSINQSQQISASNEDIIRHEKELTYLQKLIAQYVQVDYESVLLSLKV